jgi:RND family efflux transporter MFP subunit
VAAQASVVSAQQALEQATTGPQESEIDAARLSVEQAEITLEQSRLSLQQAQDGLAQAQLVAPGSGTVLSVEVAVGAMLGAGTPVVTLLDTDRLEFHTTNLSERDLAQISPGQEAEVTLKAYPNDPLEAVVVRIGVQAGAPVGDAATFPVVLAFSDTDLDLRPGMTGRVEIRN